jgi:hypothetical protein
MKRFFIVTFVSLVPLLVLGEGFVPLSPNLPVDTGTGWDMTIGGLINSFFSIAVFGSATLAVVMIAFGGIEWMLSNTPMKIGNGRERVTNAIFGLVVVLSAVLILKTINPNIINFGFLSDYVQKTERTGGF